ncbi:MAG: T9SS type A sorting domain-containing protein [Candidatus Krumholzibacteria bacterium]
MLRWFRMATGVMPLAGVVFFAASAAAAGPVTTTVSDSLYDANHPKLLFNESERRPLRSKLWNGGRDDDAYAFIRNMADNAYPFWSTATLLWNDFGTTTIPHLGLATHVPRKLDNAARDIGRDVTYYLADNYDVDFNEANSAFRLQALAFGYDMFFKDVHDSLRVRIRDEMVSYMQAMTNSFPYLVFVYRPYLANHSAMVAGALGLAAICLDDEVDPALVSDSMERADAIIDSLLTHQFGDGGSYNEGSLYAAWTMRHLIYYFHAREAYDGFRYADHPKIRALEEWLAYEILPEGLAHVNNINGSSYSNYPLSMNNTYFDWAQNEWDSGLSAWIWEHTSGTYGVDTGLLADKVATALWHQALAPQQPDALLPRSRLWQDRGFYSYRTGWQTSASSEDVLFTFYAGKFHGGHAQEDQNQFTLYGYGSRFAVDHGPGPVAKQSEAHSIVLIDGVGQHNAGSSIGTDGRISEFLMNGFADYLQGDATAAYTTHSPFNDPDQPFTGIDWSWGYDSGNPVRHARRNVVAVHGSGGPPYFIIMDDIDKDGLPHTYEWRLHTSDQNAVDAGSSPIRISSGSSRLDVHTAGSAFGPLAVTVVPFDNGTTDPDATVLGFTRVAVNPHFAFILVPAGAGTPVAEVSRKDYTWGSASIMEWDNGLIDCFIHNPLGGLVTIDATALLSHRSRRDPFEEPRQTSRSERSPMKTDAAFALVRFDENGPQQFMVSNVSRLSLENRDWVRITDGRANCASDGVTIDIDRGDADFLFYGPSVTRVRYRDQNLEFTRTNGFLVPSSGGSIPVAPGRDITRAVASPNPFNPTTRLTLELARRAVVRVTIYDVQGRLVKQLLDAPLAAGRHVVEWNATATGDRPVASGVYFMRIQTGNHTRNLKLTVLK